jgi:radical SAM-linked protein
VEEKGCCGRPRPNAFDATIDELTMTDPTNHPPPQRLRLIFAKKKEIKYIAHLDLALAWERALRRAQIKLAYSQGFNPRPKMQFASSLPLGSTGSAEIIDIVVDEPVEPETALINIRAKLPAGLVLHSVEPVPYKAPSLQDLVRQADYEVLVETSLTATDLQKRIDDLLRAKSILETRRRRGKEEKFDLRPLLYNLQLDSVVHGDALLHMRVAAGQHGNLRPESVLKALGLEEQWAEIDRTRLIFKDELD